MDLSFDDLIPAAPSSGSANAISSIESSGNYRAVGPETGRGRALGRYQIMTSNIGPWSREILGREVTPTEFMASPEIQDRIFHGKFGQYEKKYGPEGAARAWFAGEGGMNDPGRKDVLGTTVAAYADKFNRAYRGQPTEMSAQRKPAALELSFDDLVPQMQEAPAVSERSVREGPPEATFADRFDAIGDRAAFDAVPLPEKKFGLGDTWPAKLAKSVYGAVTLPGDVMSGKTSITGPDGRTNPEVIARSFDLAGIASPGSVANRALPKPAPRPEPVAAPKTPTIADLKTAATAGYESDAVKGLVIKGQAISNFGARVRSELAEAGFDENVAPKTSAILAKLDSVPAGGYTTGQNLNSLRKTLRKAAESPDSAERAAANQAIEALDDMIPNLAKGDVLRGDVQEAAKVLATARANYSAAKHSEAIDKKTVAAELRASAANSGMNVANTVRQRLADVLLKDKERRGFTEDELALMKQIVEGTRGENLVRVASNILGGGGGLGTVAAATAGGLATGGPGAALPLVGFVLKAASNRMTLKNADRLSQMIRDRAPLASAGRKFEEKAAAFAQNRSPKTMAAVSLAARNFATNLQASGFNVNARDLMNGLSAGGIGRADEGEQ